MPHLSDDTFRRWCKTCAADSPVRLYMSRDAWRCCYCGKDTNGLDAFKAQQEGLI